MCKEKNIDYKLMGTAIDRQAAGEHAA